MQDEPGSASTEAIATQMRPRLGESEFFFVLLLVKLVLIETKTQDMARLYLTLRPGFGYAVSQLL